MTDQEIRYEKAGRVGWLTFNRPERLNAITYAMLREIEERIAEARSDDGVRVLVVTGEGRAFSAGTDLGELSRQPPTQARGTSYAEAYPPDAPAPWSFPSLPKPVIAAVNGAAVGLGVEFALQADMRIAGESARFGWVHLQRGLVPDTGAGTWLLPRVVGVAQAARLLFTGEIIGAEEALRIGLVEEVVPDAELHDRALTLAERAASVAPLAAAHTKRLLYHGLAREARAHVDDNTRTLTGLFASEDHREGVRAFLEKRQPAFQGR